MESECLKAFAYSKGSEYLMESECLKAFAYSKGSEYLMESEYYLQCW